MTKWVHCGVLMLKYWNQFLQTTVGTFFFLSYRFAFSQHAISSSSPSGSNGLRAASSPADGLWGYVLWQIFFHADSVNVFVSQIITFELIWTLFQQVDRLTPPTSTEEEEEEEAEAIMTTSADKVAIWGSHATSGESTVRVIFILLRAVYFFDIVEFWTFLWFLFFFPASLFFFSSCTINHLRMSRGDPRNIIEYRDLDAPDDMDFF